MTVEARRQATFRAQEASMRRAEAQIQAAASMQEGKSAALGRGRPQRASARRARERGFGYQDAAVWDAEDPGGSASKPGDRAGLPTSGASGAAAASCSRLRARLSMRIFVLTLGGRALAPESASCPPRALASPPPRFISAWPGCWFPPRARHVVGSAEPNADWQHPGPPVSPQRGTGAAARGAASAARSHAPGFEHPTLATAYPNVAHWAARSFPGGFDPRLAAMYRPTGGHAHPFAPPMSWPFPGGAAAASQARPQRSGLHPSLAAYGMPVPASAPFAAQFGATSPAYQPRGPGFSYDPFFAFSFAQPASGAPPGSSGGHFLPGSAPGGGGGGDPVQATPRMQWATEDQRARLGPSWPGAYSAADVGGQRPSPSAPSHSPSPLAMLPGARHTHPPSSGGSSN